MKDYPKSGLKGQQFIYGEILPSVFIDVMARMHVKPGAKYYDLGAGTGKTVALACMMGLNAVGIDMHEARVDETCQHVPAIREASINMGSQGTVRNIKNNFTQVDWSDADIVFTNSILFPQKVLDAIGEIGSYMKPGSFIVHSTDAGHDCPGPFQRVGVVKERTSWSISAEWAILTVLPNPHNSGSPRPKPQNQDLTNSLLAQCSTSETLFA